MRVLTPSFVTMEKIRVFWHEPKGALALIFLCVSQSPSNPISLPCEHHGFRRAGSTFTACTPCGRRHRLRLSSIVAGGCVEHPWRESRWPGLGLLMVGDREFVIPGRKRGPGF